MTLSQKIFQNLHESDLSSISLGRRWKTPFRESFWYTPYYEKSSFLGLYSSSGCCTAKGAADAFGFSGVH